MEFKEGQLIVGGDFNTALAPLIDTSSGKTSTHSGIHKCIIRHLHDAPLIDVWRLHHAWERDYTFYSTPHKVYSRIDYFLVPHDQLEAVRETEIGNIMCSDHAPISMRYDLSSHSTTRAKFWRLNESLLQTAAVMDDIEKELRHYFQSNDTGDCSPGILWEAHKTVIGGC